ncbi:MAG: response regulator [Kofleriaceae bacterium]
MASPGPRPRLLVVDDERYNRELLLRTFARQADVTVAADRAEALAACGAAGFDVVITDQRLASGRGTELAAELRRRWPAMRIVLITGAVDDPDVTAARGAGVIDDVIGKPFAPVSLRERVLP